MEGFMRNMVSGFRVVLAAAFVVALGASPALAQNQGNGSQQEGFGVQVIGGPVFSNVTDISGIKTENKTGFLVGAALGGNRGGTVGVEADVLYGKKGVKINGIDFDQSVVHVPVMLKVNIGSANRNGLTFFGLGGGFFDWQFNGKLGSVDVSNDTNGYEVGYVLGGGVEVLRLSIQARYIRGVREINKKFEVGSSTDSNSQAVAILFAFRIN
jgi:hypothetical protein